MAPQSASADQTPPSVLSNNELVVFYGSPRSTQMGVLGTMPPDQMSQALDSETRLVDQLNGDSRGAVGAMDIITGMVSSDPGPDGIYVRYLDDATIRAYIAQAAQANQQVILDMQLGRGNVLDEVKKLEPYLLDPRVHVAIDPEYAVGPNGVPIQDAGHISGDDINQAQDYLDGLVKEHHLPPKILVVHQYLPDTIVDGDAVKTLPGVDVIFNFDGIGAVPDKVAHYQSFAQEPYAHKHGYTVFLRHDPVLSSEQDLLAMSPQPDLLMYQ